MMIHWSFLANQTSPLKLVIQMKPSAVQRNINFQSLKSEFDQMSHSHFHVTLNMWHGNMFSVQVKLSFAEKCSNPTSEQVALRKPLPQLLEVQSSSLKMEREICKQQKSKCEAERRQTIWEMTGWGWRDLKAHNGEWQPEGRIEA